MENYRIYQIIGGIFLIIACCFIAWEITADTLSVWMRIGYGTAIPLAFLFFVAGLRAQKRKDNPNVTE